MDTKRLAMISGGIILVVILVFIFYEPPAERGIEAPAFCEVQDDCVPATPCHPRTCLNKEYVSLDEDVFCTTVCEPGTMDCGQGFCDCRENKCTAVFSQT